VPAWPASVGDGASLLPVHPASWNRSRPPALFLSHPEPKGVTGHSGEKNSVTVFFSLPSMDGHLCTLQPTTASWAWSVRYLCLMGANVDALTSVSTGLTCSLSLSLSCWKL
jgi:hypothetical protein